MTARKLYIAAYDVADPARLRKSLQVAKQYACGGQKSVHEVYLNGVEHKDLLAAMHGLLDLSEDRFALIRLDPRAKVYTLGRAVPPQDASYFYVG